MLNILMATHFHQLLLLNLLGSLYNHYQHVFSNLYYIVVGRDDLLHWSFYFLGNSLEDGENWIRKHYLEFYVVL